LKERRGKMKKLMVFVFLVSFWFFVGSLDAAIIINTGVPTSGDMGLYNDTDIGIQWAAAEFPLDKAYTITDILGYMTPYPGTRPSGPYEGSLTLTIYGDGGEVPDTGDEKYSQLYSVTSSGGWQGLSGLNWNLPAGTYWVAFEVRSGNTYYGGMPWMNTPNPLDNYAAFLGTSYNPTDHIEIGIKINAVSVPESVSIDIFPKTCPNECPIKGGGAVEVVVHGTTDFDVNDIDIASVRLEEVAAVRSSLKDKSSPVISPSNVCDCTTDGKDGEIDLCLKFDKKAIISALSAVVDEEYVLTLSGELSDGIPIEGNDCIVFVEKGKKD
jgi:hypothetical protein